MGRVRIQNVFYQEESAVTAGRTENWVQTRRSLLRKLEAAEPPNGLANLRRKQNMAYLGLVRWAGALGHIRLIEATSLLN